MKRKNTIYKLQSQLIKLIQTPPLKMQKKKNEEIITEIIDPMPGVKVDDPLNLEKQFEQKSNALEKTFDLSNQLQDRLDNILLLMKQNDQPFNEKPIQQIPNDPLSNEKTEIKTDDIYIDDNYTDFFQHLLLTIEKILNLK